jgi:aminoglycoside 6'-N-acetyltransferase
LGYLQYYHLAELPENETKQYCLETVDRVYGIDIFIGEPDYWSQGIGTKILSSAVDYIFAHLSALSIAIDPDVKNLRAIRCYEKCGFVKVKLLPQHQIHEGKYQDCWLMARERNES